MFFVERIREWILNPIRFWNDLDPTLVENIKIEWADVVADKLYLFFQAISVLLPSISEKNKYQLVYVVFSLVEDL